MVFLIDFYQGEAGARLRFPPSMKRASGLSGSSNGAARCWTDQLSD
ncbi:hypothetical protein P7B02_12985 [Caulobacter segnis]|nr:hypothetical protein [Caulobacter segnis]MDG2522461.1 hypothetical protein [Caulobacter segnis]